MRAAYSVPGSHAWASLHIQLKWVKVSRKSKVPAKPTHHPMPLPSSPAADSRVTPIVWSWALLILWVGWARPGDRQGSFRSPYHYSKPYSSLQCPRSCASHQPPWTAGTRSVFLHLLWRNRGQGSRTKCWILWSHLRGFLWSRPVLEPQSLLLKARPSQKWQILTQFFIPISTVTKYTYWVSEVQRACRKSVLGKFQGRGDPCGLGGHGEAFWRGWNMSSMEGQPRCGNQWSGQRLLTRGSSWADFISGFWVECVAQAQAGLWLCPQHWTLTNVSLEETQSSLWGVPYASEKAMLPFGGQVHWPWPALLSSGWRSDPVPLCLAGFLKAVAGTYEWIWNKYLQPHLWEPRVDSSQWDVCDSM